MSYMKAKSQRQKPAPNPIVVGCGGTIYLAFLYAVAYGVVTLLGQRVEAFTPEYLKAALAIPDTVSGTVLGQFVEVPIGVDLILFVEVTLLVVVLLGFTSMIYSYYHQSAREKEGWELYAEEAERQAKMVKTKGRR